MNRPIQTLARSLYNFAEPADAVREAYAHGKKIAIRQHQAALDAQTTRIQKLQNLESQMKNWKM